MKKLYRSFLAGIIFCLTNNLIAQTNTFPSTGAAGIGTLTPNASSLLEITSTTKGILIPRMTLAQRNSIATPATGLMIFQTNGTPGFYYYSGTAWIAVSTKGANTSLSNLAATTAVNVNLLPVIDNTINFGSSSNAWKDLYLKGNIFLGVNRFISNAGTNNTFVGDQSGINNSGAGNSGFGWDALYFNTTGAGNTANGEGALYHNTTGSYNTANGEGALVANTTGSYNTANGESALNANTTGVQNTANGGEALSENTTGYYNTASGWGALLFNTTGFENSASGDGALYSNTTGNDNTANGAGALGANTTGFGNAANGESALNSNTTGYYNTAEGERALYSNATGVYNTANGAKALYSNTTGYSNVGIGGFALNKNTAQSNLVAVGDSALFNNGTGASSGVDATANVGVGSKALYSNTTGRANSAFGFQSLYTNTIGLHITACGYQALYTATGNGNTSLGYQAGFAITTGAQNTLIGSGADCSSGALNNATAIGQGAMATASNQVMLGNTSVTSVKAAGSFVIYSDGRFKKNIKENVPGLDFINALKPVTYNYDIHKLNDYINPGNQKNNEEDKINGDAKKMADIAIANKEKIVYTGFVAQDVEKAADKLNYDFSGIYKPASDHDAYGLSYADFVVPLVKAVQELSKINDDKDTKINLQEQQINSLNEKLNALSDKINHIESAMSQCCNSFSSSINSSENTSSITKNSNQPRLEQNVPNPFDGNCYIGYNIPSGAHNAQLRITDVRGHILKTYALSTTGYGKQTIYGGELSSGMYQYSLLIDGKLIDTKKMERVR